MLALPSFWPAYRQPLAIEAISPSLSLLLLYVSGTRSIRPTSLPLKRGMLHYGYSRKLPFQIIISKNKEAVMSEKTRQAHFGVTIVAGYSEVVDPKNFATFEAFLDEVQARWDSLWTQVFSADPTGGTSSLTSCCCFMCCPEPEHPVLSQGSPRLSCRSCGMTTRWTPGAIYSSSPWSALRCSRLLCLRCGWLLPGSRPCSAPCGRCGCPVRTCAKYD